MIIRKQSRPLVTLTHHACTRSLLGDSQARVVIFHYNDRAAKNLERFGENKLSDEENDLYPCGYFRMNAGSIVEILPFRGHEPCSTFKSCL
jgi:hypothetical protein